MLNKKLYFMITAVLLYGCTTAETATPKLQHALLTKPQSELIAQGIARLMRTDNIAIADDVFMQRSLLVVDNVTKLDEFGNPIMGKQLNMPDRYELLIKNDLCFVRHLDSKATEPLPDVKCKVNYN
ncbi:MULTISPECIES: hypothetical protein [Pseudoalteromonas]|uniref:Lipoprotein n=1 Tax=Pseudoalteromonas haloplanktis TaxID=228 RepID=A0ABU1BFX5_PSEHA|nr:MULTISPECIES: hypothetical protein [Pseudoalteromonas]MCF6145916.1 hypothetical protein [Pseudoalteromonas mariniglutinosa NCIMB 1770]MDQ9093378.1 hypothetical protein [Pseudoalteromonas haloplanktis]BDF95645.1 hypothetical protein KAN5_24830 [Pseudoalteromonas sp. KAN5]